MLNVIILNGTNPIVITHWSKGLIELYRLTQGCSPGEGNVRGAKRIRNGPKVSKMVHNFGTLFSNHKLQRNKIRSKQGLCRPDWLIRGE